MSVMCTTCAKKFGFLRSEKSCDQCGFAHCAACLQKGDDSRTLCKSCLTGSQPHRSPQANPSAPSSFLDHRLKTLETREPGADLNPIQVYPARAKTGLRTDKDTFKRGLSVEDQKLVDRLATLTDDNPLANLSDGELRSRLDKLKGQSEAKPGSESASNPSISLVSVQKPDNPDDLLKQLRAEVQLNQNDPDPCQDIEKRLANLRGLSEEAQAKLHKQPHRWDDEEDPDMDFFDPDSEDESVKKLIKQLTEEQIMDDNLEESNVAETSRLSTSACRSLVKESSVEDEVFPWCVICNEDATCSCLDCEKDLYCNRCFKECHGEFELAHRSKPYKTPPKQT
ncbi:hypothetical protein TCAL_00099 [Tigriopus californicus]|uniref:FYVE-type domain-containing protein n=1 Tax=Tigriopus californicus TaxID=6832 RepID=A0A553PFT9_TIGCA|nr:abscission/NoCut checkpoint regulator-like [Tigriopus californicus]TRY76542.1 hypothetical protein TCAL_00099 [Tigriopus californicus]|eukprot:TCALIF_00099-PA protein Name:"Similar to Zfyve19 Zinc finger FYVE domain-containing protein 19 (Mus musculus)" AED:0.00 eAED:0.00 QI:133/1/1/1/1/1/5/115/338